MSKRSSDALDQFNFGNLPGSGEPGPSGYKEEKDADAQTSAILREHQAPGTAVTTPGAAPPTPHFPSESPHSSSNRTHANTDSNSPAHTVARQDIRASAEKILYTFLLPGAEREIVLPGSITQDVTAAIEDFGRDDPEVFDVAKDYVFQAMERDAFPAFLRMKALGNLIPPTLMLRLGIGLMALFGAFWTGFILIFLDKGRLTRCWVSTLSLKSILGKISQPPQVMPISIDRVALTSTHRNG